MQLKVVLLLREAGLEAIVSMMLPPQPMAVASGREDCQKAVWSLCEKSLGGSCTDFAVYWALVVGRIRVPMFSITPSLPLLNRSASDLNASADVEGEVVSCGASAY